MSGMFRANLTRRAAAALAGAGLVGFSASSVYPASSVGAHGALIQSPIDAPYLADPTGVASANAALASFFAAASNKINILGPGTFKLTALLDLSATPISNAVFIGVPGKTKITGAVGYGLVLLGALNNVVFKDIIFESTYVNAVESLNTGVVYSGATDVKETYFTRCKFTSPSAHTQGLAIFNRSTDVGSDTCVIDGLFIEYCKFASIGRNGCTIYNRQKTSDKYTAARRVYVRSNDFRDLGIAAGATYGIGISLDGYGSSFDISDNDFSNCLAIGAENTGWIGGRICNNRGKDFSRKWRLASISDPLPPDTTSGITAFGNVCIDSASNGSYISRCVEAKIYGNSWKYTGAVYGAGQAFAVLDCTNIDSDGDSFVSDSSYALRLMAVTGNCSGNRIINATLSTAASAANIAVVNFDGAATINNQVDGRMTKGTGGALSTQTNSAATNVTGDDRLTSSGSYTPVLTATTNIATSTAYVVNWTRVGNVYTIAGKFDADPTAAGNTATLLGISLPPGVTVDFTSSEQLSGQASTNNLSADKTAAIYADTTNDRAAVSWQCGDLANHGFWFSFTFRAP